MLSQIYTLSQLTTQFNGISSQSYLMQMFHYKSFIKAHHQRMPVEIFKKDGIGKNHSLKLVLRKKIYWCSWEKFILFGHALRYTCFLRNQGISHSYKSDYYLFEHTLAFTQSQESSQLSIISVARVPKCGHFQSMDQELSMS